MVSGPPKSEAGRRTLAVPDVLLAVLAGDLARHGRTIERPDEFVYAGQDGGMLDYSNWRARVWVPAVTRAGLVRFTFHGLRRTNTTSLVTSGVDLKTAQTRLGHSDPRLTLATYAQATSAADRAAANRVAEEMLSPGALEWGARAMNVPSNRGGDGASATITPLNRDS